MSRLEEYTEEEWSFVATALIADILDNKITIDTLLLKQIFTGADAIDAEDLLKVLVLPWLDWDEYIETAVQEGHTWPKIRPGKGQQETIMFCRACNFEGSSDEFSYDAETDAHACPECMSLLTGIRKNIEEE